MAAHWLVLAAAALSGIASHATLVVGRWPTAPGGRGQAVPAALPASAAALLHVSDGDVLRLRGQITNALVTFDIIGVWPDRRASGAAGPGPAGSPEADT